MKAKASTERIAEQVSALVKDGKYPGGIPAFRQPAGPPELSDDFSLAKTEDHEVTFVIPKGTSCADAMAGVHRQAWQLMKRIELEACNQHNETLKKVITVESFIEANKLAHQKFLEEKG